MPMSYMTCPWLDVTEIETYTRFNSFYSESKQFSEYMSVCLCVLAGNSKSIEYVSLSVLHRTAEHIN